MMKAILIRTASGTVNCTPVQSSPKVYPATGRKNILRSSSLVHMEMKEMKRECSQSIRRTRSETDVIMSVSRLSSDMFPARISEEEQDVFEEEEQGGGLVLKRKVDFDGLSGLWRGNKVALGEEREYSGGGVGKGRNIGGGNGGGDGESCGGNAEMSAHYESLLKANPGNPLILRNYGRFLHEVARDFVKAEQCYERAILASPGDGELLSLYGKLIWERSKDGERAQSYFDQAVHASPDDCYVMGSYANFLWDAEEDEDEDEDVDEIETSETKMMASVALVEAC